MTLSKSSRKQGKHLKYVLGYCMAKILAQVDKTLIWCTAIHFLKAQEAKVERGRWIWIARLILSPCWPSSTHLCTSLLMVICHHILPESRLSEGKSNWTLYYNKLTGKIEMALFFGMWVGLESWEIKTGSHIVFVVMRKITTKELTSKTNISDLICVNLFLIYYFIYLYISFYPTLTFYWFSSVWSQSCPTPCNCMDRSTPGLPVHHHSQSLPKAISVESVMPSSHLILCHPLLLLPWIFPSMRVFSNESALRIRWPKY